jgi:hypothetical protein
MNFLTGLQFLIFTCYAVGFPIMCLDDNIGLKYYDILTLGTVYLSFVTFLCLIIQCAKR